MKQILIFVGLAIACSRPMQPTSSIITVKGNQMLLGKIQVSQLKQPPFNEWFDKEYNAYAANTNTLDSLRPLIKPYRFELFLGTWCGDSKRHVPRIMKLMDALQIKPSHITIIAVGNRDTLYKQSPTHEEMGKAIYRVPHLNIYQNGKEVGRITETPVASWERDLLAIITGQAYTPKYPR